MTNEALCIQFQKGDNSALWQLWEQNQGFTRVRALRVLRARQALGRRDVELEDLEQSAWFALVAAARDYDPALGYSFLTYYRNHLRTAFAEATGTRSERQRRDPLHTAESLDAPVDETDAGSGTIGDFVPAKTNESTCVIERVYAEWLKGYLQSQIDTLPEKQARVLRLRYWQGMTFPEIASALGVEKHRAKSLEQSGLNRLSMRWAIIQLREFVECGRS